MNCGCPRRPLALVLSDREDLRERCCRSLSTEGFDVLGFAEPGDAEAWLEEDTPQVAMLDDGAGFGSAGMVETIEDRGVRLVRIG